MIIKNIVLKVVLEQNISFVYPNLEWTHLPSLTYRFNLTQLPTYVA